MSRDGDFWSRRKARVAKEAETERKAEVAEEDRRVAAEAEARSDAEILAEHGLPDPDELKLGDSVKGFMKREIPERLRRRALRSLWRSNPVLACLDGLNDYDGDYTNAATDAPGVKTAYQVGRGLRRHVEALERAAAPDAAASPTIAADSEQMPQEAAVSNEETGTGAAYPENVQEPAHSAQASTTKVAMEHTPAPETVDPEVDTELAELRPRRMRFRFGTEG